MRPPFRTLWAADTVNQFGTAIRITTIPLAGVTLLGATAWQMGILVAAGTAAFLLIGLPAGAWVDRLPRRRVLVTANLVRVGLLATIPISSWLGLLSFPQLVVVALLIGCMTVLYDVASPAMVQTVVPAGQLTMANSRMQTTQSAARLSGTPAAGGLVQLLDAATATGLSAVAYLASTLLIRRLPEPERRPRARRSLRSEIREGLAYTFGSGPIRALAVCGTVYSFFFNLSFAVQVLYLSDQLGLSPTLVGLLLAADGLGQVAGAATAGAWAAKFGDIRAIVVVLCVAEPVALLVPLADKGWPVVLYAVGTFALGYGMAVYNVLQVSFRQHICPPELFGRMAASSRMLTWGAIPLGALAGGAIGDAAGLRTALWIGAIGGLLPALWLVVSPLRKLRSTTDLATPDRSQAP